MTLGTAIEGNVSSTKRIEVRTSQSCEMLPQTLDFPDNYCMEVF